MSTSGPNLLSPRLVPLSLMFALACSHRAADQAPCAPGQASAALPAPAQPRAQTPAAGLEHQGQSPSRTPPRRPPSSRSDELLAIDDDAYGAFAAAPDALALGSTFPDFDMPATTSSGTLQSAQVRASGPMVVIFYRGHW